MAGATRRGRRVRTTALAYLMVLPAFAAFAVFVFFPLAKTFYLGMYRVPPFPGLPQKFVGFSQYASVLSHSEFLAPLWDSTLFVIFTVPVGIALGLGMAVAAHRNLAGMRIFRVIFSSTIATSVAVASVIFFTLLDPTSGLFAYWIGQRGGTGLLGNPTWALPAVAVVSMWQNLGFSFILMSAALASVPDEILDAAEIDGATGARRFFKVTVPLISPTLFFAAIIGVISGFQTFGLIDLLTQGGPDGHTNVLLYQIYTIFYVNADTGTASVMAVALFLILVLLTLAQFVFIQRRVFYADER
ncbi:MAG: carbohydrate ABC transporter permease [Acidimicrobiales bacterium]|jgi:sn-glycerol 3-phosphate transport system permease protein